MSVHTSILYVLAVFMIFMMMLQDTAADGPRKTDSFCVGSGRSNQVFLDCKPDGIIYVHQAFYGYQAISQEDTSTCQIKEVDDECITAISRDHLKSIQSECIGKKVCKAEVSVLFLDRCTKYADYISVNYECIPDNTAIPNNLMDICGNINSHQQFTTKSGYIQSQRYPELYPPDTLCTCTINTTDPTAQIGFKVLDFDLRTNPLQDGVNDWLEYASDPQNWGNGRDITKGVVGIDINTGHNNVHLNFRSDHVDEARGFLLQYKGVSATGVDVDVNVQCGTYTPSYQRKSSVCFEDTNSKKQEIFLSCISLGVINILNAAHGYKANLDTKRCTPVEVHTCVLNAMNKYDILKKCMGQSSCTVTVEELSIPLCSQDSNYFQVEYQCIPAKEEPNIIVDICGDSLGSRSVEKRQGYIESLNYPQSYTPYTKCRCRLQTIENGAEVVLTLLDMKMAEDSNGDTCVEDWVKYRQTTQEWGEGRQLCDVTVGEPIRTNSDDIHVDFNSQGDHEERGFWLKYYGRKSNGENAVVKVDCGSYGIIQIPDIGDITTPADGTNKDTQPGPSSKIRTLSLIIGLVSLVILMVALVIGMLILRQKRRKKKGGSLSQSVDGTSTGSTSEPGYSTFTSSYPGYAGSKNINNLNEPPSNIANAIIDSSGRVTSDQELIRSAEYGDNVVYARGGARKQRQYTNPAFDGNINTNAHYPL